MFRFVLYKSYVLIDLLLYMQNLNAIILWLRLLLTAICGYYMEYYAKLIFV